MSLDVLKKEITELPDQDFDVLLRWAGGEEYNRRKATPLVNAAQAEVVKALQDEGKLTKPDALTDPEALPEDAADVPEWADPHTDHAAMYRKGDIVRIEEKIYQSQFDGLNHWKPGATGVLPTIWLDITPLPKVLDSLGHEVEAGTAKNPIPWKAGIELHEGQFTTHGGKLYRVTRDVEALDPTHTPDTLIGHFYEVATPEEEFGEDEAWEDPAGDIEDFKQPTGGHDAYPLGKQVEFEGHVYESVIESNAFSPAVYPAGWKKIS
ncbi:hypothetical protein [Corynebacterium ulcerans]|uniref:hypothetical protein n=1 Tax=Corynebacterium ulcerans TaxID=65058 RepID=UPI000269D0F1|nr:hypothetical protein [Corynebacterium ulcerans]KPJ24731.1 hypothetical protein AOT31_02655 [Corynebacterium ulcerans]BAM26760.1 hypothetical protein CULC0102_0559 [Corynebacterium ulcerans 0102]BBJ71419.1 hypothetical protein CULC0211_05530 [Corynebacterium ulcerans]BBJ73724.1 hypothetical protein CULCFH20161_05510 [Corynebacterium ulcerans]BDV25300.1 hypothetical protein CULTSU28_05480 [Corynebacterium ulcerans]